MYDRILMIKNVSKEKKRVVGWGREKKHNYDNSQDIKSDYIF